MNKALNTPGSQSLFLALTSPHAYSLMWPLLQEANKKFSLGIKFDNKRNVCIFPNSSQISIGGVNSSDNREKFRGLHFDLIIADEVGSYGAYLSYLLDEVLTATLLDSDGDLILSGTPSPVAAGKFYELVHDENWSHFGWTVKDNLQLPSVKGKKNWRKLIEMLLTEISKTITPVKFRREYLASWETDYDTLLYKLDPGKNIHHIPPNEPYEVCFGLDTGYNDASSIVCLAYSTMTNKIWLLDEFSQSNMDITSFADKIKFYQRKYNPTSMICDPANKQMIQEMQNRHGLPISLADKLGKASHISFLNDALFNGRFTFPMKSNTYNQMAILEWNAKRTTESETFPADLADACLYAFMKCYNYSNSSELPLQKTQAELNNEEERHLIENAVRKATGRSQLDEYGFEIDDNFWDDEDFYDGI